MCEVIESIHVRYNAILVCMGLHNNCQQTLITWAFMGISSTQNRCNTCSWHIAWRSVFLALSICNRSTKNELNVFVKVTSDSTTTTGLYTEHVLISHEMHIA